MNALGLTEMALGLTDVSGRGLGQLSSRGMLIAPDPLLGFVQIGGAAPQMVGGVLIVVGGRMLLLALGARGVALGHAVGWLLVYGRSSRRRSRSQHDPDAHAPPR